MRPGLEEDGEAENRRNGDPDSPIPRSSASPWGLIGRDKEVALLQDAIARGRLHHAYLLGGPPGAGKTALALALAQTLNCQGGALPEALEGGGGPGPCNACSTCRRIANSNHPDVTIVAMEPNQRELGIDAIRDLTHFANVKPFEGGWRVFIVQDADRVTHEAANALLKTLEEPPPQTILVLTTAAEERVLPTIRSRCQAVQLHRVPTGTIAAALAQRFELTEDDAMAIASYAQGAPGTAVQAAQDPSLLEAQKGAIERLKVLLEAALPERLDAAGSLGDVGQAPSPALGGARSAAIDLLARWEAWWRDLLLVHQGCTQGLVYARDLASYEIYAKSLTLQQIQGALAAVQTARRQLQANAIPRIVLDVLVLELPAVPVPSP